MIHKPRSEYIDGDKKLFSMDVKTINNLYYIMSRSEFKIISSCKNASDIWYALKITHEGTNQVKESKIDMFVHQYELFKMLSNEFTTSMFTRMTTVTNSLDALGRTYTNTDIVRKFFRSLLKYWKAKVTTIWEVKDLTKLPLEELIGSLMTKKITMKKQELDEKPKKNLVFKTVHYVNYDDDDEVEEEIALIIR